LRHDPGLQRQSEAEIFWAATHIVVPELSRRTEKRMLATEAAWLKCKTSYREEKEKPT
jgi:hypothetical protein